MKFKAFFLTAALFSAFVSEGQPRFRFEADNPRVHDPVMAKEGDTWYVFSTGLQEMSSKDMETWTLEKPPMVDFDWIKEYIPGYRGGAWAPDIIRHQGKWHLFCSPSAFGVNTSVIVHLTRSTLDPSVDEPWKDCGPIIHSEPDVNDWNAIDANVVVDEKGTPWMDFGSFWDGIQLVRMKKDLSGVDGEVKTIARRYGERRSDLKNPTSEHAGTNAIEAPFIFKHDGWYYLFVSWDYCCMGNNSSYKVAVGRSKSVEGPYLDKEGRDMAKGGGTVVAFNDWQYNASGHNSAYTIDGKDWYVSHAYERGTGMSRLIIREIQWEDGWPNVSLDEPSEEAEPNTLSVDFGKRGAEVNPGMYGIFFEEINHSGTGGLYAELLRNRDFEEKVLPPGCTYEDGYAVGPHRLNYATQDYSDWRIPWDADSLEHDGWSVEGAASLEVVADSPLNPQSPNAARLTLSGKGAALVNAGYWGVPYEAGKQYELRFFAKSSAYKGTITAQLRGRDGNILGQKTFSLAKTSDWQELKAELTASGTDDEGTFALAFDKKGSVMVDFVSLMPKETYKGHGLRQDVAQAIADLRPGFVRWPGGCIVEGATQANAFKWKNTIGDPAERQSEWILWGYHTSWGFGYHEFLQYCEDMGAEPLYVTNVGLSCTVRNGDYVMDRDSLSYYVEDICDAIEYANGPAGSEWGSKRAAAGHPEPFGLKYIELGNEQIGPIYADTFKYLYSVLKERYPDIEFINNLGYDRMPNMLRSGRIDIIDPHFYRSPEYFYSNVREFDNRERGREQPRVYVGEYSALMGVGTGNMRGSLSEAAWLTGLERNGDLVRMVSYAPLIENSHKRDWSVNLIHLDNDQVVGRSAYYVQQMFGQNVPTYNVDVQLNGENVASPVKGAIGFQGIGLNDKLRNLTITDSAHGTVADPLGDFAEPRMPQGPRRRFAPMPVRLVSSEVYDGFDVEFDLCPLLDADESTTDPDRWKDRMAIRTSFVYACGEGEEDYETINIHGSGYVDFGRCIDGVPVEGTLRLPYAFERGRWYRFRVELSSDGHGSIFIDGDKFTDFETVPYSKLHAVAGYDEKSGEAIVKVVNGYGEARTLSVSMDGASVGASGKVTTLSSTDEEAENSLSEPERIVPVVSEFDGFGGKFSYTFAPYSFTILRVPVTPVEQRQDMF